LDRSLVQLDIHHLLGWLDGQPLSSVGTDKGIENRR
jgi:hypothetical protein